MYDFDKIVERRGTDCVKWDRQGSFGVQNGLLPFWIADTDFASLPEILDAMKKRCEHPLFGYSDVSGGSKQAACSWFFRRHKLNIDPSWIVPGPGVVTSLRFTIQALTESGDSVLLFTPVYDPFFAVIANSGRKVAECPMIRRDNRFFADFDLVEKKLKEGVRAVMLCNPHNPLAKCWTRGELEKIASLCEKYGVYVLSDEVHCDITLFGNAYTSMASFGGIRDRLVCYTSIGKTFNMAGLVSSFMIIPGSALRSRVEKALGEAWIFGPAAIAFAAIEAAYTHGDTWVDELLRYLEGNVRYVSGFFAENMPDVGITKQEATFLMWLDFNCLGMGSEELAGLMAGRYGLALASGVHYGRQADGFMRFNIGCPRSTLEKGTALVHRLYTDRRNENG